MPFLFLSFAGAFYRERLKNLLRLPTTESPAAVPATAPTEKLQRHNRAAAQVVLA